MSKAHPWVGGQAFRDYLGIRNRTEISIFYLMVKPASVDEFVDAKVVRSVEYVNQTD
jgi:hypothetical protein